MSRLRVHCRVALLALIASNLMLACLPAGSSCSPNCCQEIYQAPRLQELDVLADTVAAGEAVPFRVDFAFQNVSYHSSSGEIIESAERAARLVEASVTIEGPSPTDSLTIALVAPELGGRSAGPNAPKLSGTLVTVWEVAMPPGAPEGPRTLSRLRVFYAGRICAITDDIYYKDYTLPVGGGNRFHVASSP